MRIVLLVLVLVLSAVSSHAQRTMGDFELRIEGDQFPPKPPAVVGRPIVVTGNVVVTVNEIKVRADMASYQPGAGWVDLNGGTARYRASSSSKGF